MSRRTATTGPRFSFTSVSTAEQLLADDVPVVPPRRLSVQELKAAVLAAHGGPLGGADVPLHCEPARPVPAALEQEEPQDESAGRSVDVAAALPSEPVSLPDARDGEHSWVPERDGAVSLAGLAAPRRVVRNQRSAVLERPASEAPATRRGAMPGEGECARGRELLTVGAAPRIAVLGACGGSGATTVAALLGLTFAGSAGTAVAVGARQGHDLSLAHRLDVHADVGELSHWLGDGDEPMCAGTPGVGLLSSDGSRLLVGGTDASGVVSPAALLRSAVASGDPVVVDAGLPWEAGAAEALSFSTHVVLVAPQTVTGLLAAESAADDLTGAGNSVCLVTVDVWGRRPDRAGRAALARLSAFDVTVCRLPYDRHLAQSPAVSWSALSGSARAAVWNLTYSLLSEDL